MFISKFRYFLSGIGFKLKKPWFDMFEIKFTFIVDTWHEQLPSKNILRVTEPNIQKAYAALGFPYIQCIHATKTKHYAEIFKWVLVNYPNDFKMHAIYSHYDTDKQIWIGDISQPSNYQYRIFVAFRKEEMLSHYILCCQ